MSGSFSLQSVYNPDQKSTRNIWIDGYSTPYGLNDRVPRRQLSSQVQKYIFVSGTNLSVQIIDRNKKKRILISFCYQNTFYRLPITDIHIKLAYKNMPSGKYPLREKELCLMIGLGHQINANRLKIVRSIVGWCP